MREAHRPQITDLPRSTTLLQCTQVVLDGRSLLYTIDWRKGNTFETLAGQYTKFVKKNYLLSEFKVTVVFETYPQEPTIKDSTHLQSAQDTESLYQD